MFRWLLYRSLQIVGCGALAVIGFNAVAMGKAVWLDWLLTTGCLLPLAAAVALLVQLIAEAVHSDVDESTDEEGRDADAAIPR